MNFWKLAKRSLEYYWRLNLAVLAGVLLTSAVLSGALAVGDSVRESLRRRAFDRIAEIHWAIVGSDRFFTGDLARRMEGKLQATAAGMVQVEGSVAVADGSARANGVQVLGVGDDFWKLTNTPQAMAADGFIGVNEALSKRLDIHEGDTIVARVEVPGALSRDAPLSGSADVTVTIRGPVTRIVDAAALGDYSLRNEQSSPLNLFVNKESLQKLLEKEGRINVILLGNGRVDGNDSAAGWELGDVLAGEWTLADASLRMRKIELDRKWELSSDRVFLDPGIAQAVSDIASPADGVLTYLVNEIRHDGRATPYSMATATEATTHSLFPGEFEEDDAIVTRWLADDLGIEVGDEITMRYFLVAGGRERREASATFRVAGILPMDNPNVNPDWTPQFPGISDVDNCRDWDPGFPLDTGAIRDKDEDYWDQYRSTPKVFIGLRAGQQLWANRFGNATAIHFLTGTMDERGLEAELRKRVRPEDFGLVLRDIHGEARAAVANSYNFGTLFASMSFFLMAAALILTGLLFAFGVEQRADQVGLCLALGISKTQVRHWLMREALLVSVAGAAAGALAGIVYTRVALWGLSGIWSKAVGGMTFVYHARPESLVAAALITIVMATAVVYISSRAVMRIQPRELITRSFAVDTTRPKPLIKCVSLWLGVLTLAGGAALVLAPAASSQAKQGAFFSAGLLFLIAGICGCSLAWRSMERRGARWRGSLAALGRSYALRRKGRSLAIVAMMAAGVFMVTAMNAMRLNSKTDADANASGTGGFRFIGESTLPIYERLTSDEARESFGLGSAENDPFTLVQMRVSSGDDASCLNLNRAQNPRLLGVDPNELAERHSFSFASVLGDFAGESPWNLLAKGDPREENGVVPGVIDQATAVYALGKKLGDVVEYEDARGDVFRVRLCGFLANSVLQGNILIPESTFIEKYPDSGGYRMFLLDTPDADAGDRLAKQLSRMLEDRGFALTPAWERLGEFNAVQNTYLSIFSTLGGLGVLLGTVGLAILVGRNVLERQGQLGLMRAVGFETGDLAKLVMAEHWFLHVLGVLLGLAAAMIAVSAKFTERDGELPLGLIAGTVGVILLAGLAFCWWAARRVARLPLLESIRSE